MNKGFTFIEILVVIGLMVVLLGGGVAAFDRFNDKQKVAEAAFTLQNLITSAQTKARVAEKPVTAAGVSLCGKLLNYRVTFTADNGAGSGVVTVAAVCTSPARVTVRETYTMPRGIVGENDVTIDFLVLSGGNTANPATPIIVKSSNDVFRYAFTVDPGGAVEEGAFQ